MQQNDISCDICSELYSESGPSEPRILTCGHTICLSCLTHLLCSNLWKCCPYCKISLTDIKSKYPKNYALINAIYGKNELDNDILSSNISNTSSIMNCNLMNQQRQRRSLDNRSYFDLYQVQKLKEQAQTECLHEKVAISQHSHDYFHHKRLTQFAEFHLREMRYLEEQSLQRYHQSLQRLQKYESVLTLLESIIENSDSSVHIDYPPIESEFSGIYTSDQTYITSDSRDLHYEAFISQRPDILVLMKQIRDNYSSLPTLYPTQFHSSPSSIHAVDNMSPIDGLSLTSSPLPSTSTTSPPVNQINSTITSERVDETLSSQYIIHDIYSNENEEISFDNISEIDIYTYPNYQNSSVRSLPLSSPLSSSLSPPNIILRNNTPSQLSIEISKSSTSSSSSSSSSSPTKTTALVSTAIASPLPSPTSSSSQSFFTAIKNDNNSNNIIINNNMNNNNNSINNINNCTNNTNSTTTTTRITTSTTSTPIINMNTMNANPINTNISNIINPIMTTAYNITNPTLITSNSNSPTFLPHSPTITSFPKTVCELHIQL